MSQQPILDLEKNLERISLEFSLYEEDLIDKAIKKLKQLKIQDLERIFRGGRLFLRLDTNVAEVKSKLPFFSQGIFFDSKRFDAILDLEDGILEIHSSFRKREEGDVSNKEALEIIGLSANEIIHMLATIFSDFIKDTMSIKMKLQFIVTSRNLFQSFSKLGATFPFIDAFSRIQWEFTGEHKASIQIIHVTEDDDETEDDNRENDEKKEQESVPYKFRIHLSILVEKQALNFPLRYFVENWIKVANDQLIRFISIIDSHFNNLSKKKESDN